MANISVIDIGTNSVKLLVAAVNHGKVQTLAFRRETTRVGAGLSVADRISPQAATRTIDAIQRFTHLARRHHSDVFGFTTFAMRRAENREQILRRIARETGVQVRVLGGREEARLAYRSARAILRRPKPYTCTIDIGGGSTEYAVGGREGVIFARSMPLGALHLTERFLTTDPIDPEYFVALRGHIDSSLQRALKRGPVISPSRTDLVASGGSVTTVADMIAGERAGRPRGRSSVRLGDLLRLQEECLRRTIAQRARIPGLPADRADIIIAGIAVATALMSFTQKRVLRVNAGGVREGAVLHLAENNFRW